MEKMYTQNEPLFVFNEEFDEAVINVIPEDIVPDNSLLDAVLAYDKALSCVRTQTLGSTAVILN